MSVHATRVIAIRHGETTWNADARIQGHTDIPLNARGLWQAQRLAQALAEEGVEAVYSSDLARARQTAQAVSATAGVALQIDEGLRERGFGTFEGQSFEQIAQRWPEQAQRWRQRDPAFAPEGGETLTLFYERCVRAAHSLALRHPGQTIALVAHGGVLDCLYRASTGLSLQAPRTWEVGNASINRLLHNGERFTLIGWADTAHLSADEPLDELK